MRVRTLFLVSALLVVATGAVPPMVPMADPSGLSGGTGSSVVSPLGFGSPTPILRPVMRQSVSMGYSTNGRTSVSQSMYVNEMSWRLAEPLTLHLDLGIAAPMWASGPGTAALREQTPQLFPAVGLEWRPSDNSLLMLSFSRGPWAGSWSDPWASPGRAFPSP
ncbi:MAG: hypothetical protein H6686_11650 [Fibrobacteria bacterium]|nr:hypothetical protein [Fibrobacteria bacterium]